MRQALAAAGLKYIDLERLAFGSGVAVAWSESFYAVISVAMFLDHQINITYGVIHHINQDRMAALECCNAHNQNLCAYPVYLHDADNGWDIIQQNMFPIQMLRDASQVVTGLYMGGQSSVVDDLRSSAAEAGLEGEPYRWNADDLGRLLLKSLL